MVESIQGVIEWIVQVVGIDTLKIIGLAIIIVVGVALIKKLLKFAITVAIVAVILAYVVIPVYNNLSTTYEFNILDGIGTIISAGEEYELSKDLCNSLTISSIADSELAIKLKNKLQGAIESELGKKLDEAIESDLINIFGEGFSGDIKDIGNFEMHAITIHTDTEDITINIPYFLLDSIREFASNQGIEVVNNIN